VRVVAEVRGVATARGAAHPIIRAGQARLGGDTCDGGMVIAAGAAAVTMMPPLQEGAKTTRATMKSRSPLLRS
jgi:hypothetical protein